MENDSAFSCCQPVVMSPLNLLLTMHDAQETAQADSLRDGGMSMSEEVSSAMENQLRIILATTAFCWDPSGE